MAKGLRSKCRKASRRQFRNTIGKEDAEKKFTIVQSQLQQCISKGGMNSIGKIAQQFHGTSNNSDMEDDDNMVPNIDALGTDLTSLGKNPKKIPAKRKVRSKIDFLIQQNAPKEQWGSKMMKKKKMKGTGPMKAPLIGRKRTSKKKNMVSF